MFDSALYYGGFNLTMPEQDDFIGFLRDVPSYVDSNNNVGQPYTSSYVPYVLKLFPTHIKDSKMVSSFCYFVTLYS